MAIGPWGTVDLRLAASGAASSPFWSRPKVLKWITAGLFATTALWPTAALADPITALIGLIGSSLGGVATGLGLTGIGGALAGVGGFSASAFAAGAALGGSAIFGALVNIGLSVGLSLLAEALRPKPQTPDPGQRMVNYRQNIAYMEIVYGRTRKGGPLAFWQSKGGQRFYDVLIAAHEIDAYESLFADDREVTFVSGSSGTIATPPYNLGGGVLGLDPKRGQAGQTVSGYLSTFAPSVTSAHDFAGLAHIAAVCNNVEPEKYTEIYPSGREPAITALVRGKKIFDPRTNTTAWSDNAALVIADWITSEDGLNREVDWDDVAIEADVCDETVLDRNGVAQKRWTLNGMYLLSEARETVRAQLGVACDAFFYERHDGKVGFTVGRFIAPTVTISDRHILVAQYTSGLDGTDNVNAQVVNYMAPARGWLEAPSAAIKASDATGEPYEEDTINVYWINSHNQACRVAKRLLKSRRAEWRAALTVNCQGAKLQEQRFFTLDHDEAGIATVMEVDSLSRNEDGISYTVQCHSVTSADFDFAAVTEEPEPPKRTTISNDNSIPAPGSVTATGVAGGLKVTWAAPARTSLSTVVRVRTVSGPGQWQEVAVRSGQTEITIAGLATVSHHVQAQHVTASGRGSNWAPADGSGNPTLTATPGVPAPLAPEPAVFTVTGGTGNATVNFTTANDPAVAGTIFRRNTSNTETGATLVGTVYSGPNASLSFTDTPLAAGTYYYFARGLNSAGAESTAAAASGAVTVV